MMPCEVWSSAAGDRAPETDLTSEGPSDVQGRGAIHPLEANPVSGGERAAPPL